MNLNLKIETVNQLLGYLGTRPYQEVFQLIEIIQKEAKNQPPVELDEQPKNE
jgi:homoserine trans-succinylase